MKTILLEKPEDIKKKQKRLEKLLKIKMSFNEKEITIEGSPEDEYTAEKVLDAINLGFPLSKAELIKKRNHVLEILNIKEYTKRKDLKRIKARIIGKKGRTIKTLCNLTECHFELKDHDVGIIGAPECIKNAQEAIRSIIHGAKQGNVYSFLERNQPEKIIDLGLKSKTKL